MTDEGQKMSYENLPSNKRLKKFSQTLRKNATKEENHLWYDFLSKHEIRFQRQKAIDNFIADFYCHKAKLVIELDGSQHCEPENAEYDRKRTEYLKKEGLFVMCISNRDVNEQFRNVCEAIDSAVTCRLHEE